MSDFCAAVSHPFSHYTQHQIVQFENVQQFAIKLATNSDSNSNSVFLKIVNKKNIRLRAIVNRKYSSKVRVLFAINDFSIAIFKLELDVASAVCILNCAGQ